MCWCDEITERPNNSTATVNRTEKFVWMFAERFCISNELIFITIYFGYERLTSVVVLVARGQMFQMCLLAVGRRPSRGAYLICFMGYYS